MKKIQMEVHKMDRKTREKSVRTIELTVLDEILTPSEIFQLEYTLNEGIPHMRFHISVVEE